MKNRQIFKFCLSNIKYSKICYNILKASNYFSIWALFVLKKQWEHQIIKFKKILFLILNVQYPRNPSKTWNNPQIHWQILFSEQGIGTTSVQKYKTWWRSFHIGIIKYIDWYMILIIRLFVPRWPPLLSTQWPKLQWLNCQWSIDHRPLALFTSFLFVSPPLLFIYLLPRNLWLSVTWKESNQQKSVKEVVFEDLKWIEPLDS